MTRLALVALLLAGCSRRELLEEEATALLIGARLKGTQDGVPIERLYDEEHFVQLGDRPGEGHWSFWGGQLCTTWTSGGPKGTHCSNHLFTDDRGTYWIERQTHAMADASQKSGPSLGSQSESLAVFTSVDDAETGESRMNIRPFHHVYIQHLFWGPLGALVVFLIALMPRPPEESEPAT